LQGSYSQIFLVIARQASAYNVMLCGTPPLQLGGIVLVVALRIVGGSLRDEVCFIDKGPRIHYKQKINLLREKETHNIDKNAACMLTCRQGLRHWVSITNELGSTVATGTIREIQHGHITACVLLLMKTV
jgi:hypothetical protein